MIGFLVPFIIVAVFWAGAAYGRNAEAKAIAIGLHLEAYGRTELLAAIAKIRRFEGEVFTRLKKYL